jgi:hypothetical protein
VNFLSWQCTFPHTGLLSSKASTNDGTSIEVTWFIPVRPSHVPEVSFLIIWRHSKSYYDTKEIQKWFPAMLSEWQRQWNE